jgi:hypothetical protein
MTTMKMVPQPEDFGVIALVAGQENYGLALVSLGEGLWSFLAAPPPRSWSMAAKVLVPAVTAAAILILISGPMITTATSDDATVGTGLWIATAVSVALGLSYVARLVANFSPSPKEIAALGLLVAVAGFFSFGQNLVVYEFLTLPSLPTIELPAFQLPSLPPLELPSIQLPAMPSIGFLEQQPLSSATSSSSLSMDTIVPSIE